MAKYTFLLPAYKGQFLKDAIHSILYQSFSDFEILVSDDCSPDGLLDICSMFDDSRLKYRRNLNNIGGMNLVNHWNLLLTQCKSEYLIIASDDDIYDVHFLDRIEHLVLLYPDVDVIRARCQRINSQNDVRDKEDIFDEYQTNIEAINSIYNGNYIGCIGNYVFKTSTLKANGGFVFFPYAWFSDVATVISVLNNGQVNTREVLFQFRLSSQNISDTVKDKRLDYQKMLATIEFDRWMSNYFDNLNFDSSLYQQSLKLSILKSFKHRMYSQCGDYAWSVGIFKYLWIYRKFKTHKFFSLVSFIKYFSISLINHKFSKL